MDTAVALVSEPDGALRELMKRAVEEVGFATLESSSFVELDLVLRSRLLRTAPRALLVMADAMSSRCQPALTALASLRLGRGLLEVQVVLTREFGSLSREAPRALAGCTVAAVLEKPFDLTLFQAIAYRCRTATAPDERQGAAL